MTREETIEFLRKEQELNDLKTVMSTAAGRRFVWRILRDAGIFRPSFVGGDALATAFNEGSRNHGLIMLGEIMSELPASYLLMQKEAVENEQKQKDIQYGRNTRRKKAGGDIGGSNTDN